MYANPLQPEVCTVLSLGIYWACFGFQDSILTLFDGNDPYARFLKALTAVTNSDVGKEELAKRGLKPSDIGPHSERKVCKTFHFKKNFNLLQGGASHVASGSTAAPPTTALCLRTGWALGGVQDRYLRYEAAGDCHVGRCAAGLRPDSAEFAILPPFFMRHNDNIEVGVRVVFPNAPKNLSRILEFCLASLVYHFEYLSDNLTPNHPLRSTPLFADKMIFQNLRPLIECRIGQAGDPITVR